ncbi:MAG: penicillin-binding transpeptidase domain-containing protein [Chitinispirillaceae bacterium]
MSSSPMIRRIQKFSGSHNRFKIPKKGRIRIALAVILLIASIKFISSIPSESAPVKKENEKKAKENLLSCVNSQQKPVMKIGKRLESKNLKKVIKTFGITLAPEHIIVNGDDSLKLFLSVDTALQNYAGKLFRRYRPRYAAAAAIDPVTGRVLSLVSYTNKGEMNRGDDLYFKSIFPAASIFKTVTAAAAIEQANMHAGSEIAHSGRNHTLYRSQLERTLARFNNISLERAFAYSINPVFGRIALFNLKRGILEQYGRRFGFDSEIPFELDTEISEMYSLDSDFAIAEMASGFNQETSISPLFGSLIASAVSENGVIPRPSIIDSVYSREKETNVYVRKREIWRKAIEESTAHELKKIMSKVPVYGTARKSFRNLARSTRYNMYEYGGKTGSVDKEDLGRVDWFVGFARHPEKRDRRIAVGVVTTHSAYWTVRSSFIASEMMLDFIRGRENEAELLAAQANSSDEGGNLQ